jgi:hypothetical protein
LHVLVGRVLVVLMVLAVAIAIVRVSDGRLGELW